MSTKTLQTTHINEKLIASREEGNIYDRHAVAILKNVCCQAQASNEHRRLLQKRQNQPPLPGSNLTPAFDVGGLFMLSLDRRFSHSEETRLLLDNAYR